ncbi:hypothetical protein FRX31_025160 [Thalictrum thalictroides]|uniref:Uncharacterized protein n=1 Tax=Thalictrum thalictroides TaxID=46969 RepID=A0A7J6VK07_THATH|nr:hypothetical protein FRX31_025160 [Thalictrum thalictroides]
MQHPDGYLKLEFLDLSGATPFREFQGQTLIFDTVTFSKIDLSGTQIAQVPPFVRFVYITKLLLRYCCHLETMPPLAFELDVLDLSGSIAFKNFHDALNLDLSRTQIGKLPVLSMILLWSNSF